jgi:hypothetical protein
MNIKRKIAVVASALLTVSGIALVANQANATTSVPAPSPSVSTQNSPGVQATPSVAPSLGSDATDNATDGDNVQSGDQSGSDVADTTDNATDGDNVQSGDQSGSDVADTTDTESIN